ncbi:hypothetical protein [[Clostridium] symbiosum]|jgi:hypothetical protein|uniref:hypothetical protein n=1 Tax=Clostridium symbiosum TaxID=1512 RepID=UPI002055E63A|nr:hypothetical protein [[Clostridium] symbiosum]MCR1940100.1 hypothetical protein [[Clostridium] symbiosum]DAU45211.1 MAG TPA: hypothetical protein [Caudoviricetes sp.]
MRIKIIMHVPTSPSPAVGQEYDVIRVKERTNREGGNIYFVNCEGQEVGVLTREMTVIKKD